MPKWVNSEEENEVSDFTSDITNCVEALNEEYEAFKEFVQEKIDEYNQKMYGVSEEDE